MRVRSVVGIGAVVVIALALGLPLLLSGRDAATDVAPPAPAPPPRLTVEVLRIEPRRLSQRLDTTGSIRADEQVDLVSEVVGVVRQILFREGARVERGELLLEIADDELQAQRDRALSRLRLAESRELRQRELREQGIVSEQDYDLVSNELSVLRAELRVIGAQLSKTELRAPFAGTVGLRYVSEGSLLTPQTRIATLQSYDPVKIDFTLPEKYAGRIGPGSRVEFRVKGSADTRIGEVFAVEPRIDPETRSLSFRARSPNPDGTLVPGAFADVSIVVDDVAEALVVPSLAVVPELGGKKIFVFEDGLARVRRVETGIRTDTEVQITAGLEPGEQVIVSAIQRLRPDLPVEPLPAKDDGEPR